MPVLQKSHKFRVRVWGSYRTYRSSGYGYGSVTEITDVPGIVARAHRTHTSPGQVQKYSTRTPDIVARAYRTYRSSGYEYEGRTELTEGPGTGMNILQNLQEFSVG